MQKSAQSERSETHGFSRFSVWKSLVAGLAGIMLAGSAMAQVSFVVFTNYPAANVPLKVGSPTSVRLADFNKDGYLDLVAGFSFAGGTNVQVQYGLGDGSFGAPAYLRTAATPGQVAVGDGNGDGVPDILAACSASGVATFTLSSGTNLFVPYQAYATGVGSQPADALFTDLNSDGTNDMVVTLGGSNSIAIFMARGDDTFYLKGYVPVGPNPTKVIAGDFNGDGRTDLAVVNSGDNTITILLGYQDGTFATPISANPTGAGTAIADIALVDFNRDGYTDILVTKPANNLVIGLRNNGFGGFIPTLSYSLNSATGIKVADFNADGTNDFAVTSFGSDTVSVFVGTGTGFALAATYPTDAGPVAVDVGDMNGDGIPDLIVACETAETIDVLLNQTPVAYGFSATTNEDTILPLTLSGTTNVTLNFNITRQPTNGGGMVTAITLGGADVEFDPAPDFFGTTFFEYTVDDGVVTSVPARVYITVLPVNDPPSFDVTDVEVPENWRLGIINNFAINRSIGPANEGVQGYKFICSNDNPSLFSMQPYILVSGRLMFTPARNANGSALVTAIMEDTGGTARGGDNRFTNTFTIRVTPVNNPPSFTLITNNVVVLENSGLVSIPGFANNLSVGPADEVAEGQQLQDFTFVSTSNLGLFLNPPFIDKDGNLTFTPNTYSNGFANFTVRVQDTGGTINPGDNDTSLTKSFRITVKPVNQAPSFALTTTSITCDEDATNQVVLGFVDTNSISVGPANEIQSYSFIVQVVSNATLFQSLPQIRKTDGALLYKPRPNYSGVAEVRAIMRDSGGVADGGINSLTNLFTISVTPVNDAPTATMANSILYVFEDCGPVTTNWFRNIRTGPTNDINETTQTVSFVTFVTSENPPGLFAVPPTITTNGVLSFTPAPDANGEARIDVELHDSGPSSSSGDNSLTEYHFALRITPINDAPRLTINRTVVNAAFSDGLVQTNVLTCDTGAFNETNQTLSVQIVNNTNKTLFSRGPVIYPDGTLVFAPSGKTNAIGGRVTLGIRVVDGGGISYGGKNASAYQTNLTINITQ